MIISVLEKSEVQLCDLPSIYQTNDKHRYFFSLANCDVHGGMWWSFYPFELKESIDGAPEPNPSNPQDVAKWVCIHTAFNVGHNSETYSVASVEPSDHFYKIRRLGAKNDALMELAELIAGEVWDSEASEAISRAAGL